MQFGYALALAIVLMYWTFFTTFEPYYFLAAVGVCYGIFVYILSITLPQYTLCTSLGYLIDERNLRESVGAHRLEEAHKRQIQRNAELNFGNASRVSFDTEISTDQRRESFISEDSHSSLLLDGCGRASDKNSILATLVKSDTQSLRNLLPEDSRKSLRDREFRRNERRSLSDGVSAMRKSFATRKDSASSSNDSGRIDGPVDDSAVLTKEPSERASRRKAQKRAVSASGIIQSWQCMTEVNEKRVHDPIEPQSTKEKSSFSRTPLMVNQHRFSSTNDQQICEAQSTAKTVDSNFSEDKVVLKTDGSVGALSDVDLQEWVDTNKVEENQKSQSSCSSSDVIKHSRNYFLGNRYHTFSHVFGSLFAFFLVGHRVEVMLSDSGAIDPSENTWELGLGYIFWMQTGWYALFLGAGFLILLLFLPIQEKSFDHRVLITSTLLDILLSSACLAILFLAEAQRCCDDDEVDSGVDCCPFWGSRTDGGLGDIEPWTALIGLRVFRFVVGRKLVEFFDKQSERSSKLDAKGKPTNIHSRHGKTGDHSMQTEVGTPLALWERAISKYPDIVDEYGEFSAELFHAMLGLEIAAEPVARQKYGSKTTLPAGAQSIIAAGNIGKPVKTIHPLRGSNSDLPSLAEEAHHDTVEAHSSETTQDVSKFEIDDKKLTLEEEAGSNFIAPNARLLRSMRRCDRKMLPILTEWECVDVVMTQYEIVYFEALDVKSKSSFDHSSFLALQATNGGKGLRLRDVAAGRKVVGHFDLSETTEIRVERSMPLSDSASSKDISALYNSESLLASEFWADPNPTEFEKTCREARWEKVKEDRLRLFSAHGSLVLRFYSDLDDVELHTETSAVEDETQGPLRKNIAFQWAQNIAYICGKATLHQSLPHFGANNSDELRDLLQVANHHEKEHEVALKSLKNLGIKAHKTNRPKQAGTDGRTTTEIAWA
eukprot:scaffold1118_cov135-Cylindrotheca_fusiformis.AAC.16